MFIIRLNLKFAGLHLIMQLITTHLRYRYYYFILGCLLSYLIITVFAFELQVPRIQFLDCARAVYTLNNLVFSSEIVAAAHKC